MGCFKDRFYKFVGPPDENGCQNWIGGINTGGYGNFRLNGKVVTSSRMSWLINYGSIPKGMWVLHKCDNRKCVNVNHLFLGNAKDNMKDKVSKGRQSKGLDHRKVSSFKRSDNPSKYIGVYWDKYSNKWKASITINGKCVKIGRFSSEELAHQAYQNKLSEVQ